ncbi:MAG TPA: sigma 54-interacting transcriptional regulator, partial [Planctomycetaceae bacterium]|nr:sigma 54-interacting transcriptional regulator [Planctomycetaceae bacterium]
MSVSRPHSDENRQRPHWLGWDQVPWLSRSEAGGPPLQLSDRLLDTAASGMELMRFLRQELPEIAGEFSVQWAGIVHRAPNWKTLADFGRLPQNDLPYRACEEALDRNAAGYVPWNGTAGPIGALVVVPLGAAGVQSGVLVLFGRSLGPELLPAAWGLARVLGQCVRFLQRHERDERRIDRLRTTLRISSQFAAARESQSLLELIAKEATRLLDTDRASIFIWDRELHEVVACPALGVEGGYLRLPDNVGIVGRVLHSGDPIRVDDAYQDSRFNKEVDAKSGYKTRNLLCVPLLDAEGQRIGAFEVINKLHGSFDEDDEQSLSELGIQAAIALQNTREREQLVRRQQQLTEQVTQGVRIIGESPAIVALRATIERLAATDLPVLILGESGTGKEVVSQALHYRGARRDHPFIAVNCAALTETLLESELFGHEKGAFTDAHETHQGKFELAGGGTLFLDEIGDMSLSGQAKLLRVLEQKVVTRVGGSKAIPINVRVVAATNTNLAEAVRQKKFREDLYYRLSVVTLDLPPLRNRPEDILLLAEYFLTQFCRQANRRPLPISPEARKRIQMHAWPGNIRELRNLMERVAFLCPNERVEAEDVAFILSPDRTVVSADLENLS